MQKLLMIIVTMVVSLGFLSGCYLHIKQRELLYHPQPYQQNLYSSITIKSDTAYIDIITLVKKKPKFQKDRTQSLIKQKAIIYFGGNAEPVVYSADMFKPLHQDGYDVYLVNYRGYGTSTGTITEKNNYTDALAVYDYINDDYDSIDVIGRSIGTGVATYLAEQKPVDRLVLITPYDSVLKLVQKKFPFLPISLMLKDTYPSEDRAKNIDSDVLILSAENDTLIPVAHAENLANAFTKTPAYHEIQNANHNDIMTKPTTLQIFYQFFHEKH